MLRSPESRTTASVLTTPPPARRRCSWLPRVPPPWIPRGRGSVCGSCEACWCFVRGCRDAFDGDLCVRSASALVDPLIWFGPEKDKFFQHCRCISSKEIEHINFVAHPLRTHTQEMYIYIHACLFQCVHTSEGKTRNKIKEARID